MTMGRLRVVIYGLGQIGMDIARLVLLQSHLDLVGAIDRDPAKVGAELSNLLDLPRGAGIIVRDDAEEALSELRPDVVVIATTSVLRDVLVQARPAMAVGASIVSTCEELVYPYTRYRDLAIEINNEAVAAGVGILGIGINPGFVMDLLPVVLTAPCSDIRSIHVTRVINASERRQAFVNRLGIGLDPAVVRKRVEEHRGPHTGLLESLGMIAGALGWQLDRITQRAEPIIAEEWIRTPFVTIAPGQVMGFAQEVQGWIGRREVIELRWRATIGERYTRDALFIDGVPPIDLVIRDGIHGDLATAALATRAIPAIAAARPGLHTVLDLPILHYVAPPWRGGQY
ncbi:MAG: oxidoreductase [Herpetosiphonaceae bacterium]|nr:MAG: oxidoreductase [Herpetosiphonaceae bacterium]